MVEAPVIINGKLRTEKVIEAILVDFLQTDDICITVSELAENLFTAVFPGEGSLGCMTVQSECASLVAQNVVAENSDAVVFGNG